MTLLQENVLTVIKTQLDFIATNVLKIILVIQMSSMESAVFATATTIGMHKIREIVIQALENA